MKKIDPRDEKYNQLIGYIENQVKQKKEWQDIYELNHMRSLTGIGLEQALLNLCSVFMNEVITLDEWSMLIDFVKEKIEGKKIIKMGTNVRNNSEISTNTRSAWVTYKNKLLNQGWTKESVENLEFSAYDMLQNLTFNSRDEGAVKGLAIGNVQSGKTANMVALMAMAADNGFNYFVVLSGVIENLRRQTSDRLHHDLNYAEHNIHWKSIDNPSRKTRIPEHDVSTFSLQEGSKTAYYSVVLKNSKRLKDFTNWLLNSDPSKTSQMKILIIDDEADQASINTNDIDEENPTTINRLISELVHSDKVLAMNYVAYTATPYANVLNDSSIKSLYPKDFIVMLDTNGDYIGPEQLFTLKEPETQPSVDIIREISQDDRIQIMNINKGELKSSLPKSLADSIIWFLLSVAAIRALEVRKPLSMLVHTSFKIDSHAHIANKIGDFLMEIRRNYEGYKPKFKRMYENERRYFSRKHFLEGMEDYSTPENIPDYPSWDEVVGHLDLIMDLDKTKYLSHIPIGEEGQPTYHHGIHLVIDNSRSKSENQIVRLVYPQKNQIPNLAPAFIVIGGNTLSRGLTIEGLTSTYFLRDTNQADTLMQMGRWFGYRKGYEIFPRIWLDRVGRERFEFLAQLNSELRDEVQMYSENGLSPLDYAIKIKNSPSRNFMRITANNKQQSVSPGDYDFSGYNVQTIYFENDESKLQQNYDLTKEFLNSIEPDEINGSRMIWRDIDNHLVRNFLNEYQSCELDKKMSSLASILKWIDHNNKQEESQFSNWNIILASVGDIEETASSIDDWNIHGFSPKSVVRSKLKNRGTQNIANIGVLRTPSDLVGDINLSKEDKERYNSKTNTIYNLRKSYGLDRTPLLIIYRIDKDGKKETKTRTSLNFPVDPIGISLLMPGFSRTTEPVTKIQIKLPDEELFEEEGD